MAKTIKFNLVLDGNPIRELEELQENFSIEEMFHYYQNGLLLRWLDVRGYEEEYQAVKSIDKEQNKKEIIKSLIRIFRIGIQAADVDEAIAILDYLDKQKSLEAAYKENATSKKQIIDDYHAGYDALIRHIIDNKEDIAALKADAIEMVREYTGLFSLDRFALFRALYENAPKAIYVMLTHDLFRSNWLEGKSDYIREKIKELSKVELIKAILEGDVKIVKRNTQAMWDPIERPEVKLMVLSIRQGAFVKNAGEFSEKLGDNEINQKFLRFNGLEYQCNDESYELLYMEA